MSAFPGEIAGLQRSLDFHLQRHGVLAGNLANADTPGYRPRELSFEAALQAVPLAGADPRHLGTGGDAAAPAFATTSAPALAHADGNGVEIEQAMAQVTANRLRYETGIELMRRRLGLLRYAAADGGGGG